MSVPQVFTAVSIFVECMKLYRRGEVSHKSDIEKSENNEDNYLGYIGYLNVGTLHSPLYTIGLD